MSIIEVRDLRKVYGGRAVVDGVSFSVEKGEIFGILGPNGSGKSTLFRLLATILPPQQGEIAVCGHSLRGEPDAVRRAMGVVFQSPSLDLTLTVEENLHLQSRLYAMPRKEARAAVPAKEGAPATAAHDRADGTHPAGRVAPPVALGLVGLPPQHRDPGPGEKQRPDGERLTGGQSDEQQHAHSDRTDCDQWSEVCQPALASPAALALPGGGGEPRRERGVRVPRGRQEEPETGVQHGAEAAEGDQHQEAHPDPEHRETQVVGKS